MGNVSKLKVAIGQMECIAGQGSRNEAACRRMVSRALDDGADLLVVPNSLDDERDVRLIGLNDSRIDVSGNVVLVDANADSYRIALGPARADCDFSVQMDLTPYTVASSAPKQAGPNTVVVRPVGIRERGKLVRAYDGGSYVVGSAGQVTAQLNDDFEEDYALVSFDGNVFARPASDGKLLDGLVSSIRRFDAQVLPFEPTWVIGLSGGLDSSVTAALLALALGPDRVVGYNLATRFNSASTRSNAAALANSLEIPLRNGSIENAVVSVGNALVQYGYPADKFRGLVLENVQARMRGNLLATFAAVEGGVVVNNGNKIESALGYATLYGDAIGALAPLGDLTKVQLFEVARAVNETFGEEVVPENLLPVETEDGYAWETMPSAELASGQLDPMKWFYHDWLIPTLLGEDAQEGPVPTLDEAACDVMARYLDNRLADTPAAKWVRFYGLDDPCLFADDLEWVVRSMRASAFKRIQAPPHIVLASPVSVAVRDESQTPVEPSARYQALMRRIRSLS